MTPAERKPAVRIEVLDIPGPQLTARAVARIAGMLVRQPFRPTSAEARFSDDNGPKGGDDIRCALTVKIPRRPAVHVEDVAGSPRMALDGALVKLERQLVRLREVARERRRYPKKYFAANRELRRA